jgi:hypothetical protein
MWHTLAVAQEDEGSTASDGSSPATALTYIGSLNETVSGSRSNA